MKQKDVENQTSNPEPVNGTDIAISNNVGSFATINSELIQTLANIKIANDVQKMVADKIKAPFNVPTPKEKVRKRPDGFDYVEGSWMDHVAKEHFPLYEYKLEWIELQFGWVNIIISLKDKITGNVELGAGAARIQVPRSVDTPGFRDVIDLGNNLKAALTQAIKNAQSRFGVAADVYQKRESVPTQDEGNRFTNMLNEIQKFSPTKAKIFQDQWNDLGVDYSDFLDKWQIFLDKYKGESSLSSAIKEELGGKEKIKSKKQELDI